MSLSDKNRLDYTLSMLRRAVDARLSWPVSPAEAAALLAEVEHLRAEVCAAVAEERAAVVAWLHREAERIRTGKYHPANREYALLDAADALARNDHREGDK